MKAFRIYYRLMIFLIVLALGNNVSAQHKTEWVDISLIDTVKYVHFGVSNVNNYRYPPSNLFDSKYNTCWVNGSKKNKSTLFLKMPELKDIIINIFPGYGKSEKLYFQNAHPKKIRLSVFAAINPDGYVSEIGTLYKAVKFPLEQTVHLTDSFGIQSVSLDFSQKDIDNFKNEVYLSYDSTYKIPKASTCLILEFEVLKTYPGNKYDDVCISELFFNDCFISPPLRIANPAEKVYLNTAENALLLDNSIQQGVVVYSDILSVMQIIEVSENKKWAILISMPAENEGRAETSYLLFDLFNKVMVNSQLEKSIGNYLPGNEIYFDSDESGLTYLTYLAKDGEYHKIELR